MPLIRIANADDPRVKLFAGIRDPELLRRHRLFAAEGRLVVERVLSDSRYTVRSLLLNRASYDALTDRLADLPEDVPVLLGDTCDFKMLTGFNLHRGCIALVERPAPLALDDAIDRARLVVVLEDVTDADNVGGVFRNAAAFDVEAVLLSATCCDPLYRKSIRTSMAATLRVSFARMVHWEYGLDRLRERGFSLVALTPSRAAQALASFCRGPRPDRIALLVGTEGEGLKTSTLASANHLVRIPMSEQVDSLNLAVAVGIALERLRD
jgi:tRNA G18 (ribose-2'-O)-methylase SpoU